MAGSKMTLEWVKPPRQARSQRTLERILDATESLIAERGVDNVTVAEVAQRAQSSVGSLYGRFQGKEALVRSVFERFLEQAEATVESALSSTRWRHVPMFTILDSTIAFIVQVFHERGRLIAALTQRAASDAEVAALGERLGTTIAARLLHLVSERGREVGHPTPDIAIHFCTWLVLGALEADVLRRSDERAFPLTREQLTIECTRMCCAYLRVDSTIVSTHEPPSPHVRVGPR